MADLRYRALFSDIGGVLGTNGWDTPLRIRVCEHFSIDQAEIEERHRLMFDSYERGHMNFEAYLKAVFFTRDRPFHWTEVRNFVYNASCPWPENIQFLRDIRRWNGVKVGLISNEGQGIAEHRVEKFGLREAADFMVISHFARFRKPDPEIWYLALNLAGVSAEESIYIDDRPAFAQAASDLGLTGIHHVELPSTCSRLAELGLRTNEKPER